MTSDNLKAGGETQADPGDFSTPPVVLEAFPEYLIGFPMIVAVEVRNPAAGGSYYNLPDAGLLKAPGPVKFTFVSRNGLRIDLPAANSAVEEPPRGFTLEPGESRRMLFDIAGLEPELEPGSYRVEAVYFGRKGSSTAPPVEVKIAAPTPADAKIAAALRSENDFDEPSWANFLSANWRTVDGSRLSKGAKEALAFHLFVHRAVYGPDPVARLDSEGLKGFVRGPLEGEAAVLRHEKLVASKGDAATQEADILKRWPGLKERVEENKRGEGFLTVMRKSNGAEQEFEKPPKTFPYRP